MDFNVCFIGEKRLGKTSVLASMVENFKSLGSSFIVEAANQRTKDDMKKKLVTLKNDFDSCKKGDGYFHDTYSTATLGFDKYSFKIKFRKSENDVVDLATINFNDIPGEFFDFSKEAISKEALQKDYDDLEKIIDSADIIIFAIDSVGLMEMKEKQIKRFTDPEAFIPMVMNYIKTEKPRTCLLVPLKCEKYYREKGEMSVLLKKVLTVYKPLTDRMAQKPFCDNTVVAVAPILTMGNMVFSHFQTDENGKIVLENRRPVAYYEIIGDKTFSPKFCEQPLLYVIKLMMYNIQSINYLPVEQAREKQYESGTDFWAFVGQKIAKGRTIDEKVVSAVSGAAVYAGKKAFRKINYLVKKKKYENNPINQTKISPKTSGDGYRVIQDPFTKSGVI